MPVEATSLTRDVDAGHSTPGPSLPFVLSGIAFTELPVHQTPPIETILEKLDELHALVVESRRGLDGLREMNVQIMQALKVPTPANGSTVDATSEAESNRPLKLRLLGSLQVMAGGRPITRWPSKKARLLLAYLGTECGRMVPKDMLVELFWPEASPERGSNNLSIAVHQIRTTLGEVDTRAGQAVVVKQGQYGLDQDLVMVDLWEFQEFLWQARRALEARDESAVKRSLTEAVLIFRGEFLESDPYEEWAAAVRRSSSGLYGQALAWLTHTASRDADWPAVIDYASRMLQRESCDEAAHRWLMLAHWKLGNRPQAIQQYQVCEVRLRSELAVEPSDETRQLYSLITGNRS